jgi:acetyl-CoA carboxylase carboxyl transferase subunit beta
MSADGRWSTGVSEDSQKDKDPTTSGEEQSDGETRRRSRLRWKKKDMPGGLWVKCDACSQTIYRKDLEDNDLVCPHCSFHFTVTGSERVKMVADSGTYEERFAGFKAVDRLEFENNGSYAEKVKKTAEKTGHAEALLCGLAEVCGRPVVLCVLDFKFLGGSMGEVVGEKFALSCELAASLKRPLIVFTSSGGARMHEGVLSLMQMAKTCSALAELSDAGGFSICVMANPTTGGVTASFAMVTDLVLAEPGALIGFAGPRVIATTIKQELPPGFQRSEFLLEKGHVDAIVARTELRETLAKLVDYADAR